MSVFLKKPASTGFNSFIFSSYENLQNNTQLFDSIRKNQLVLLTDEFYPTNKTKQFINKKSLQPDYVFYNSSTFNMLKKNQFFHAKNDMAKFVEFSPSVFKIRTQAKGKQLLVLFQNNYPGWHAKINGKETEIFLADNNFMSIIIPKGTSEVVFEYNNKTLNFTFYLSSLTFLFLVSFLILQPRKQNK